MNSNVEGHPLRQQTWEYYKLHGLCCLERSRRWKPSSTSLIRQRSMKLFSAQLGKPPSWARPSCFVPFAEENAGNFANHITSCLQKGLETMDGNTIFVCLSFCWEEQLFFVLFRAYTVHSFRTIHSPRGKRCQCSACQDEPIFCTAEIPLQQPQQSKNSSIGKQGPRAHKYG